MKANELRIGNFVRYSGFGVQETLEPMIISFSDIGVLQRNEPASDLYSPIKLTEELLLKFGWIWNEECNSYEHSDVRMSLAKNSFSEYDDYEKWEKILGLLNQNL